MLLVTNGIGYRIADVARIKSPFFWKCQKRKAGGDESQLLSCSVLSSAAAAAEEEYLTCNDN